MLTDLEIAQRNTMLPVRQIAEELGITEDQIENYGRYKAKIDADSVAKDRKNGKLILVTAITPTPAGEGKTTTTIGLADAMKKLGKRLDVTEYGGAPLLGVNGCVIISHGSSNAKSICSAIGVANDYVKGDVLAHIRDALTKEEALQGGSENV